ncbi:MAG TPA: ABC transporter permease [Vicinamibacterales bacterium]|nr:ABC transporter permease [Vicinamibacterales bacterium]
MLARLRSLWRNLRHRDRVDRDLDSEVQAMFDLLVDEKINAGLTREHARRAATIELGRVHGLTQQVREQRTGAALDALFGDLRYGARMLRANPGFTAVVVLSLAIGIGANSAVFSVANALMLRTLNVPDPGELFTPRRASEPLGSQFSFPVFEQLRDAMPGDLAAMSRVMRVQARMNGEATPANMQLVSGEFFEALKLTTSVGRLFTRDDNRVPGGHPIAIVSEAFWRRRLGGSPDVIGRELTLNGGRVTIIGVAPAGFTGVWLELPVDAWVPLAMQAEVRYLGNFSATDANLEQLWMPQEGIRWLDLVARAGRADGPQAAALNVAYRPIAERDATATTAEGRRPADSLVLEPYGRGASGLRTRFRTPLFALMAMVALLLLIACVNTANLLLARAAARQREMAVRLSIGASRARIICQMLTESTLLGLLAAAGGLLLAPFAAELLIRTTLGVQSGPLPIEASIDSRVLLFTAAITLVTSLLCGLVPAFRATDVGLADTLKAQGRGTHGGTRLHLARLLVGSQVSLSLLLVVAAGLFLRSLGNLSSLPLGFDPSAVISASINPRFGGYQPADLPGLYRRVLARIEAIPGVQSAALAVHGVMSAGRTIGHDTVIAGYQPRPGESIVIQENRVTPAFLSTVGIDVVAGRDLTDRDIGAQVAVINEAMARRYFEGRDPIGQRFGPDAATIEIVGVARDARVNSVREPAAPMAFLPIGSTPGYLSALQVRVVGDSGRVATSLARAIQEVEPGLPVDRVSTVPTLVSGTFRQEQLVARLTTVLGLLALGLACLGLYGLMAYTVKRRTSEIGVRFALGAARASVLWMVLRESMLLVAAGLAAGLPMVLLASRYVASLLFEVPTNDPATIAIATLLLLLVGAGASYLPALRASRVEPLVALRLD